MSGFLSGRTSLTSVAVSDLADGTDGQLITWAADATAATVAVGTATHVLTSNGAGAAPTFATAAGTDIQTFTSSGTWTKASGKTLALVEGWGGGGSGSRVSSGIGGAGGGGGTYSWVVLNISDLGSTETVTIGAGGTAITGDSTNGNAGGNTTLGSKFTIYKLG